MEFAQCYYTHSVRQRAKFRYLNLRYSKITRDLRSWTNHWWKAHGPTLIEYKYIILPFSQHLIQFPSRMSADFGRRPFNYSSPATWNYVPTSNKNVRFYIVSIAT